MHKCHEVIIEKQLSLPASSLFLIQSPKLSKTEIVSSLSASRRLKLLLVFHAWDFSASCLPTDWTSPSWISLLFIRLYWWDGFATGPTYMRCDVHQWLALHASPRDSAHLHWRRINGLRITYGHTRQLYFKYATWLVGPIMLSRISWCVCLLLPVVTTRSLLLLDPARSQQWKTWHGLYN